MADEHDREPRVIGPCSIGDGVEVVDEHLDVLDDCPFTG
jgi:hypothetical protein